MPYTTFRIASLSSLFYLLIYLLTYICLQKQLSRGKHFISLHKKKTWKKNFAGKVFTMNIYERRMK